MKRSIFKPSLLLASAVLAWPLRSTALELFPSEDDPTSGFGTAVSVSNEYVISTAPYATVGETVSGAGYLYRNLQSISSPIREAAILSAPGVGGDAFGRSVSVDGTAAVIGSPEDGPSGSLGGKAYLFRGLNLAEGSVGPTLQLFAGDTAPTDRFGWSVALFGSNALVSAVTGSGEIARSGAVYLFRDLNTASVGTQAYAKLTASDAVSDAFFGRSVALHRTTAVVGADGAGFTRGAAYVYGDISTATSATKESRKLMTTVEQTGDRFGWSVDVSWDTAIVGAPRDNERRGAAYIFRNINSGGSVLNESSVLRGSDAGVNSDFGHAVAISDDEAIVGAHGQDGFRGAVYLYDRVNGISGERTETVKITAAQRSEFQRFGISVDYDGYRIAIGAAPMNEESGGAYIVSFGALTTFDYGFEEVISGISATSYSADGWNIGEYNSMNRLTVAEESSIVLAGGSRVLTIGRGDGSNHNTLTINGRVEAQRVFVGGETNLVQNFGNTLVINGDLVVDQDLVVREGSVLLLEGTISGANSYVSVAGILAGSGVINGTLFFQETGKIELNPEAPLTVNGNVLFESGGGDLFGIDDITGLNQFTPMGTYTLIESDTDFSTLPIANWGIENAYHLGGNRFAYFQEGSLQIVVIPEPSSAVLLLGAFFGAAALRRGKRRL